LKVLITGASGFIGQYLIKNLDYITKGISLRNIDNINEIKNYDATIHLAGKAHDLKKVSDDGEYFKTNTDLTIKLFDEFLKTDSKIFIFMSTVKAVADKVEGVLTEESEPNPKTAYGKSKLEAEKYILNNLPKNNNQKVYILRPCMIHGPGNKGNLNLLYAFVKKGIPFPLGAFNNSRSFLSVDNLSFIISEILKGNIDNGIYNLADSGTLSINQLVETIGKADNKKSKDIKITKTYY
jgi:nucleoside-diphosphate-sugar epimerase